MFLLVLLVVAVQVAVAQSVEVPKPPQTTPKPKKVPEQKVKYAAASDSVRLDFDSGVYKYAYATDDHFKTEERKPDGTIIGYYGFMDKNGVPTRYKYTASSSTGYKVTKEDLSKLSKPTAVAPAPPPMVEVIDSDKKQDGDTNAIGDDDAVVIEAVDILSRIRRQERRVFVQKNPGEPDILVANPVDRFLIKASTGFAASSNSRQKNADNQ